MKILVTGGAGFIGSALIRHLIRETQHTVINLDALTYAGHRVSLASVQEDSRYFFEHADIRDSQALQGIFSHYHPDAVMHLAAESHVDRSIEGPAHFIETNLVGTYQLLQCALDYWRELPERNKEQFRFHHVSTDEVFGSLGASGLFNEQSLYRPNSPYSASKAGSDHLVRAWHHTYGLPMVMSNCSNNYGPYQYPEKLIPVTINQALAGNPLPVYGRGENIRDWLYVEDHVRGLLQVLTSGRSGESYNIGGNCERTNLELVRTICGLLDEIAPDPAGSHERQIRFVEDRAGHDYRYAIDSSKIRRELGWNPREDLETGLRKTIAWYLENQSWCETALNGDKGMQPA